MYRHGFHQGQLPPLLRVGTLLSFSFLFSLQACGGPNLTVLLKSRVYPHWMHCSNQPYRSLSIKISPSHRGQPFNFQLAIYVAPIEHTKNYTEGLIECDNPALHIGYAQNVTFSILEPGGFQFTKCSNTIHGLYTHAGYLNFLKDYALGLKLLYFGFNIFDRE